MRGYQGRSPWLVSPEETVRAAIQGGPIVGDLLAVVFRTKLKMRCILERESPNALRVFLETFRLSTLVFWAKLEVGRGVSDLEFSPEKNSQW